MKCSVCHTESGHWFVTPGDELIYFWETGLGVTDEEYAKRNPVICKECFDRTWKWASEMIEEFKGSDE